MRHFSFKNLLLLVVFLGAILVRFYNFPNRINYGLEQGISLISASQNINEGISLLGIPHIRRQTSSGHQIYANATFSYSLALTTLIVGENPIIITATHAMLYLLTGILLYLYVKKYFGYLAAITTLILFLFSYDMIIHSLVIWIINFMPLIGIVTLYYCHKLYLNRNQKNNQKEIIISFLLGIISGIGVGLDYVYVLTAIIIAGYLLVTTHKKTLSLLIFIFGGLLANITTIIFDLRHEFYYTKTLWQLGLDMIGSPVSTGIEVFHFFQWWPFIAIIATLLIIKLTRRNYLAIVTIIVLYVGLNLNHSSIAFDRAIGMDNGMNYHAYENIAINIANDHENDPFNIVYVPGSNYRAYGLRYLLAYKYNEPPLGVENYSTDNTLYVFAPKKYDFNKNYIFEIGNVEHRKISVISDEWQEYSLYKLE